MLRRALALFSTALLTAGLVVTAAIPATAAAGANPLAALRGFTVLTEGDAITTASAHETEGSWAVGGDLLECTDGGVVDGSITVENLPGVTYLIDGIAVSSSTAATTTVTAAPGSYAIEAIADDPDDTVERSSWTAVIGAASTALCGDLTTLALTGGSAGGWIVAAALLVGLGAVLAILSRPRSLGRHRATV